MSNELMSLKNVGKATMQDLAKKPYTIIPFSISKIQVDSAIQAFFEFLSLSENVKKHIDMKISPLHRRGEVGFTHRDPQDNMYNDSKDFFHYHPIIHKHYAEFVNENSIVKNFIEQAHCIWEAVHISTKAMLSLFEQHYPGTLSKVLDTDVPHILLRFLRYDYIKSGRYLAQPHFDAGSFTIAIAESSPGLRIGTHPQDLELVTHTENSAIFMVSSNFRKIVDNEQFKPGWHDVVQLDESKVDKSFSRWAIVAFIDGHRVEAQDRQNTHKWAQEAPVI